MDTSNDTTTICLSGSEARLALDPNRQQATKFSKVLKVPASQFNSTADSLRQLFCRIMVYPKQFTNQNWPIEVFNSKAVTVGLIDESDCVQFSDSEIVRNLFRCILNEYDIDIVVG